MAPKPPSGTSTPNSRFQTESQSIEERVIAQTTGLVQLSDFRKRRAEAAELRDRAAEDAVSGSGYGSAATDG